jgi:NAD dependent epimerase/dehydratase family enzyme
MGNGRQIVSWIHEKDLANAILHIYTHSLEGVFNISAPTHYSNREFMRLVRKHLNIKIGLSTGKPLLEIGARLMGTETELILKSRYVMPQNLLDSGFDFAFKGLPTAMKGLST